MLIPGTLLLVGILFFFKVLLISKGLIKTSIKVTGSPTMVEMMLRFRMYGVCIRAQIGGRKGDSWYGSEQEYVKTTI